MKRLRKKENRHLTIQSDITTVGNTANNSAVPTTTQYYLTKISRIEKHYKAIKASPFQNNSVNYGVKDTPP